MKFFNPTNVYKELVLLQEIEKDPSITQKELGNVIGAAPSMVNVYIKELEEQNYLNREYISTKTVNYRITPEGIKRKNYLLIVYMRELLALYYLAKNNVEEFLSKVQQKGYKNLLLYGAGEVAETIVGVIRDSENITLNVLAVVDDDEQKYNTKILGYNIISRQNIDKYPHDAIIITSYAFEDDIINRLKGMGYDMDRVVRFFGVGEHWSKVN